MTPVATLLGLLRVASSGRDALDAVALDAADAIALDCETTGLDARRDRVVAVAAWRIVAGTLASTPALDVLVHPGRPIPARASAIHGIHDSDVAAAQRFAAIGGSIAAVLRGVVLVGHDIGFDAAILTREARRAGLDWPSPPMLDTRWLWAVVEPRRATLDLAEIAAWLGAPTAGRHTASGDARMAADIFVRLAPRLAAMGIRTLGSARGAAVEAARRATLHRHGGW